MKVSLLAAAAAVFLSQSALAAEVLSNGGFETGNFSGWTVSPNPGSSGCDQAWTVSSSGSQCFGVSAPIGAFGAYTALDGFGPLTRTLSQSFNLASVGSATLSWSESAAWSIFGALDRTFTIDLRDAANALLANVYTEVFATGSSGSFGLTAHSLDLTSLLAAHTGQNVNLAFTTTVPESFTGPAGFLLDGVSLNVTAAVPEPATVALVAVALLGLRLTSRRTSRA